MYQWPIFLTVQRVMRVVHGPGADPWGQGGHCAATAMFGATLAELVTGDECTPCCGAARIILPSGQVAGYTPDAVSWAHGRYHSWFTCDGAPVDLRLCLVPAEMARLVVPTPNDWPLFAWGQLPPWLELLPQPEATATLRYKTASIKATPLYASFQTAAHLVRAGDIATAGALLGSAVRSFLYQVERME